MTNELRNSVLRDSMRIAVPVEPEEKVLARRANLLEVLEREIAASPERMQRERARLRWRRSMRIFAAAAALFGTLGLGMLLSGHDSADAPSAANVPANSKVREQSFEAKRVAKHESLRGRTFETREGHEKLVRLAGGTEMSVAAWTRVTVVEDLAEQQDLRLTSGAIALSVPPERPRTVRVETAHAQVLVTGTVFSVEVGKFAQPEGTPHRTRVKVSRGHVLVKHAGGQTTLEQGDVWLSPLTTELAQLARASQPDLKKEKDASSEREQLSPSTLAAQNRILEQALAAEERGDKERAAALISEFLMRYPSSPLRGSALTVRKRLAEQ